MFSITDNKGFQITFGNGFTVSVQFGKGNYCEHRYVDNPPQQSQNTEIAVIDESTGKMLAVMGWELPERTAKIIGIVGSHKGTAEELQTLLGEIA